jgi:hypothetical protein
VSDLRATLLGDPADLALAGTESAAQPGGTLTIELVRGRPAATPGALAWDAATATIAGEDGVWRRLPWPAGARAFHLPGPTAAAALVAGPAELTGPIAERLRERGLPVEVHDRADLDAIAAASVVCLPVTEGAPPPPEAMAVMAAGRLLVAGACEPAFGLQPGIDCFMEPTEDGAAQRAEAALRWPEAFDVPRALARVAAARQHAEVVLHRLAVDAAVGVGPR